MDNSFFSYLQRLEMMAFFSGFPLIYVIVVFIAGKPELKTSFKNRLVSLLPLTYALIGVLFLGLQLKNLYPDYSIENIREVVQSPYLTIWALLSLLFFIPVLRNRPVLSLCHSLVFFILMSKEILSYLFNNTQDKYVLKNAMKIYSDSLMLISGVLIFIAFVSFLFHLRTKKKQ